MVGWLAHWFGFGKIFSERATMNRGRNVAIFLAVAVLSAGCGSDSSSTTDPNPPPPPPPGPSDDLAALSDDFEDGNLSGWNQFNPQAASVTESSGQLRIEPASSLWFNATTGILVSKLVAGDFKVTSQVTTRSLSDPAMPPSPSFRLGGLMARNPSSASGENYVFIVVGADGNDLSVETKTTVNSNSTFQGPPWPNGEGELRICRIGSTFNLYIRTPGQTWQLKDSFNRPDLPDTLQVGAVAYANQPNPDLRVTYESIDFSRVSQVAECVT